MHIVHRGLIIYQGCVWKRIASTISLGLIMLACTAEQQLGGRLCLRCGLGCMQHVRSALYRGILKSPNCCNAVCCCCATYTHCADEPHK